MNVLVLEGGTTTSRATVVRDGRVVAHASRRGGAADQDQPRFRTALANAAAEAVRQAMTGLDAAVACGMLGSEHGLVEVPHVPAPAGCEELAAGTRRIVALDIAPVPITVIPGVRTVDDLCRGEETAAIGLGEPRVVFPGSHTKLVELDRAGRVVKVVTTAGGEMVRATVEATLAGADAGPVEARIFNEGSVNEGGVDGSTHGLGHAVFQLRARRLLGRPPADPLGYLVGAMVADDLRAVGMRPFVVAVDSPWADAWARAFAVVAGESLVRSVNAAEAVVRGALLVMGKVGR